MRKSSNVLCCGSVLTALFLVGCMSHSGGTGQLIARQDVDTIKKGVTTRAEIEAKFGPPTSISIAPQGKRAMLYMVIQTEGSSDSAVAVLVPGMPINSSSTTRQQMLEIIIDSNNRVEDYDFSDGAKKTDSNASIFTGTHSETTAIPVQGASPK